MSDTTANLNSSRRAYAKPIYRELASLVQARLNCIKSGNAEWEVKHGGNIVTIVGDFLPSGSGWDNGTELDLDASTPEKLVFTGSYHHMNDGGYYDGWTDHTIIITPSLVSGFDIRVTGRDRNGIKDYLAEMFHYAISRNIWQEADLTWHVAE